MRSPWMKACLLLCLLPLGCTKVVLSEEQALVCADGIDNDNDGNTDCEDASCDASGVCEVTEVTCQDELDNDGDELVDCEDSGCREGGFCDSVVAACTEIGRAHV